MLSSKEKFRADLEVGEKGERHVATALRKHYKATKISWQGAGKAWDFRLFHPDGAEEKFEVKTDFRARLTGNLFFEYSCSEKPSGLVSTQADKWAVLVPHLQLILVFPPKRMLDYLKRSPRAKEKIGGDRKAVKGYLIAIKHLLQQKNIEQIPTKTMLTDKQKVR